MSVPYGRGNCQRIDQESKCVVAVRITAMAHSVGEVRPRQFRVAPGLSLPIYFEQIMGLFPIAATRVVYMIGMGFT